MVVLDWLTLTCYGYPKQSDSDVVLKLLPNIRTQQFNKVTEIYYKDIKIAIMTHEPYHGSPLKKDLINIKLENQILYDPNLFVYLDTVAQSLGIHITGISRIDIAHDFNYFANGYTPASLIADFYQNNILYLGRSKFNDESKSRKTKKQIDRSGDNDCSCSVNGKQKKDGINYQCLRMGKLNALKTVKLYDKTQEMKDVKFKGWIADLWKAQGLNVSNVWRLEVTIHPKDQKLFEPHPTQKDVMQVIDIEYDLMKNEDQTINYEYLKKLYLSVVSTNFQFVKNDGQKNKSRMEKIKLFNDQDFKIPAKIKRINGISSHTRTEKIFVNTLFKAWESFQCEKSRELMYLTIKRHSLETWFFEKHPDVIHLEYLDTEKMRYMSDQMTERVRSVFFMYLDIQQDITTKTIDREFITHYDNNRPESYKSHIYATAKHRSDEFLSSLGTHRDKAKKRNSTIL